MEQQVKEVVLSMETVQKIVNALMQDPKVQAFDAINVAFMQAQAKLHEETKKEAEEEAKKVPVIVADDKGNVTESTLDEHMTMCETDGDCNMCMECDEQGC